MSILHGTNAWKADPDTLADAFEGFCEGVGSSKLKEVHVRYLKGIIIARVSGVGEEQLPFSEGDRVVFRPECADEVLSQTITTSKPSVVMRIHWDRENKHHMVELHGHSGKEEKPNLFRADALKKAAEAE